jgi:hypothetical protein
MDVKVSFEEQFVVNNIILVDLKVNVLLIVIIEMHVDVVDSINAYKWACDLKQYRMNVIESAVNTSKEPPVLLIDHVVVRFQPKYHHHHHIKHHRTTISMYY